MDEHPPICPKTEWKDAEIFSLALQSDPLGFLYREIRARFQACAWQDRADRWNVIWQRGPKQLRMFAMAKVCYCLDMAKAWREWEKK